jgi:hypothetical protein
VGILAGSVVSACIGSSLILLGHRRRVASGRDAQARPAGREAGAS